jgi:predicted GH43/DUF377 family glycosyl hydrolase
MSCEWLYRNNLKNKEYDKKASYKKKSFFSSFYLVLLSFSFLIGKASALFSEIPLEDPDLFPPPFSSDSGSFPQICPFSAPFCDIAGDLCWDDRSSECGDVLANGEGGLREPVSLSEEEPASKASPQPLDLNQMIQEVVLETRQIEIEGYPGAFNPSIVYWNNAFLLCFRIRNPYTGSTNQIGFSWMDSTLHPIGSPFILQINGSTWKEQDPRLIVVQDRLYMVYSNLLDNVVNREIRRVFVAEIVFNGQTFFAKDIECFKQFPGEKTQRWEKNWVPFNYQGQLLLGYSLSPHYILKPIQGQQRCEVSAYTHNSIHWNWGALRGGTPALLEGEEYLSFFHSSKEMRTLQSKGKKISHYFIGAYTFSKHPPFHITRVSSQPIIGRHFYDGLPYKTWKPLRVVFPCGFVSDPHYIWIVYGKQDHEIWVAKLDKEKLFKSLVPVVTLQ